MNVIAPECYRHLYEKNEPTLGSSGGGGGCTVRSAGSLTYNSFSRFPCVKPWSCNLMLENKTNY